MTCNRRLKYCDPALADEAAEEAGSGSDAGEPSPRRQRWLRDLHATAAQLAVSAQDHTVPHSVTQGHTVPHRKDIQCHTVPHCKDTQGHTVPHRATQCHTIGTRTTL